MTISETKAPNPVRDFLGEFALAVHRHLIYPPGHPLLAEKARKVAETLGPATNEREPLEITVTSTTLVVSSDPDDTGTRYADLAQKLRDLGIGGISIGPEADALDIRALLEFLSHRSRAGLTTLEPGAKVEGATCIEVRPISLSGLEISWDSDDQSADRLTHLWVALDRAVAGGGGGSEFQTFAASMGDLLDDDESNENAAVARLAEGVTATTRTASGSAMALGHLREILQTVGVTPHSPHAATVRKRLAGLIGALDPETIRGLAASAGPPQETAGLIADVGLLGDRAVARVLKALANPSAKSLTDSLARLFGKMARQSTDGGVEAREETQRALRRSLVALLKEWALEDPNPAEYGQALNRITQRLRTLDTERTLEGGTEPERIIQMAIELATFGPVVENAVEHLLFQSEEGFNFLVELIEGEDEESPAVVGIASMLSQPERIRALADAEDVSDATLRSVVRRVGDRAIPPLLDVLADAESRVVRKKVFRALVAFRATAAEAALRRLPADRWYVTRNLLVLARKAGYHFPWFDPDPYMESPEATIRREAYLLAYLDPKRRTKALEAALEEGHERIVMEGLAELEMGVPSVVATSLSAWILDPHESEERRTAVINAVRTSRAPVVLEALIEAASYRSTVLRRRKLRKPTDSVLAAIAVLEDQWDRNPKARAVLDLTKRSRDSAYQQNQGGSDE